MLCGHREQNVSFYPQSKKCNLKHRQLKLRFAPTTLAKVERRRSEAWGRGPLSEGAEAAGHPSPDQGRPLIPPLLLSRKFTEGHGGWAPRGPRRGVLSKLPADGGRLLQQPRHRAPGTRGLQGIPGSRSRCPSDGVRALLVRRRRRRRTCVPGTGGGSRREQQTGA